VNKAMADRLGLTPEEAVGKPCYEYVHGTDEAPSFCPHEKLLKDRQVHRAEIHEEKLDGDFNISVSPIFDANNGLVGSVHVMRDITEHKRADEALRASEERYRSYIEVTGQIGWTTNDRGEVEEDNPSWRKYTGQVEAEIKGRGWSKAVHPDDVKRIMKLWQKAVLAKRPFEAEYRIRRFDGVYRHFVARGVPVSDSDGNVREWVGACIDITKRKSAEERLQKAKKELEQRVEERTADLQAANEELKKAKEAALAASRAKSTFLANMSHEIRCPMTSILGMSELLSKKGLSAEQAEYVDVLKNTTEHLLELINDLLDLSRIEAGRSELKEIDFDLAKVLQFVVNTNSYKAREKDIALTYRIEKSVPTLLTGSPTHLSQILVNLVSNAIKFTEKGEVAIKVDCEETAADPGVRDIHFYISDTGIGIPPEKREAIFDKFTQVDDSIKRRYGGTGLGLAIVKGLTNILGGNVGVESEPGKGSVFFVTLPFKVRRIKERRHDAEKNMTPADKRRLDILLIEDQKTIQFMIKSFLKETRYRLDIAEDGAEGLEKFKSGRYSLVLMDIQMPVMDGSAACREIRKWERDRGVDPTPVIALTALTQKGTEKKDLHEGFTACVSKPVRKDDLLAAIFEKAVERRIDSAP